MPEKTLTERTQERQVEVMDDQSAEAIFSPEVLDAMRLADIYESVQPEKYVLPLDALVGFSPAVQTEKVE